MKTICFKNYEWKRIEESDISKFTPEYASTEKGKTEFEELLDAEKESKSKVPANIISEYAFLQWYETQVPKIEEKYKVNISELFRYSAYNDIEDMIKAEYEYREFHKQDLPNSRSFMERFRLGLGFGVENWQKAQMNKAVEKNLAKKKDRIIKAGHKVCDRCDGHGEWNRKPGYTCFKCGGTGFIRKEK